MNNTPTPETDAARHDLSDYGSPVPCSWGDWIHADVASKLERERDEGIWRRVHMIPFTVTIPENERRERHEILGEFEAEAAGILNWAIRGLLESRDIGLRPPPQVVEATRNYREESDQFGSFLIECTEKDITGRCGIGTLAKTYAIWCDQNSEQPRYRGTRQLRKVMSERGYHIEPDRNDHPTIHGIKLKLEEKKDAFGISA